MTTANYLKNQVYLYSLETGDFYTDEEEAISQQYFELLQQQKELQSNLKQASKSEEVTEEQYQALEESVVEAVNELKKQMNDKKNELKALIATNNDIRTLREDALKENKIISIFDSTLLRVCNIKPKELSNVDFEEYMKYLQSVFRRVKDFSSKEGKFFSNGEPYYRIKGSFFY